MKDMHAARTEVTVIGVGAMGGTIARILLEQGRRVTVWNRTAGKADGLVQAGARLAPSAAAAMRASPLVVMCVYDYAAADDILQATDVAAELHGRVLVHLSTGSPDDARKLADWVAKHGARYLDGAIQAAPSQMGQPDTPLLLSGDQETFREVEALLRLLAGDIVYLGAAIDAAATLDMATLSYVYGAFAGFVHGARLAEAAGLDVAAYGRIVNRISPSFGAFFEHEGAVIGSGDFTITESPMRISIQAVRRILQTSRTAGVNAEFPAFVSDWFDRAEAAGLADCEVAALIKVVRGEERPCLPATT